MAPKGDETQEKRSLRNYKIGFIKMLTRDFKKQINTKGTHSSFYAARQRNKKDVLYQKKLVVKKTEKKDYKSFEREKEVLGKTSSVRIVEAFGYATDGEVGYLILERLGRNLTSAIQDLNWGDRLRIIKQLGQGLQELHGLGYLHLDLKPDNVMLTESGEAKLVDFGGAAEIEGKDGVGTSGYSAPEATGFEKLYQSADIYSLGIVIIQLMMKMEEVWTKTKKKNEHIKDTAKVAEKKHHTLAHKTIQADKDYQAKAGKEMTELALKCVEHYAKNRPTMEEVMQTVDSCIRELTF